MGIMQVIPEDSAAPPISIPNVEIAEANIHAGAKMMRASRTPTLTIATLDPLNKSLMTFASYKRGSNRIANLRKRAASEGLDPDQWFGNVELVVARELASKPCSMSQYLQITWPTNFYAGGIQDV